MATQSGRADPSLADVFLEEGYRFDFFAAVRLLEWLYPDRQPVGGKADAASEIVRFRSRPSLGFPASAVYEVLPPSEQRQPARMTVMFMGLTGPLGVLPRHYTELLIERARQKDRTLHDFLDLFHHRLVSLFYRAWEKYRFPIAYERAAARGRGEDRFSEHLFDFIGMGTPGLRGRLQVRDEALLFYAGLLAQHPRSAAALAGILADYFEVPVEVVPYTGEWLPLAERDRTQLGSANRNNVLGDGAVLGSRAWDQQAKFTLRIGPLGLPAFRDFLPTGRGFRRLVNFARFLAGEEFNFDIRLVLRAPEVPWCRLGQTGAEAPRLGWSTWLKTGEFTRDADDPVFAGDAVPVGSAEGREQHALLGGRVPERRPGQERSG
jgi:type VI secretion system protein ImpH